MITSAEKEYSKNGVRVVSLFEGAKGLLVLLAGLGLLEFIHKDLHAAAEEIVRHFHLNPARHYTRVFIEAATHLTDRQLLIMAASALLYSVLRFVEAVGLWLQRKWAEWFGLLTGGIYIPIELMEIMRGVNLVKAALLIVNAGIVGYLAYVLRRSRSHTVRQQVSP